MNREVITTTKEKFYKLADVIGSDKALSGAKICEIMNNQAIVTNQHNVMYEITFAGNKAYVGSTLIIQEEG